MNRLSGDGVAGTVTPSSARARVQVVAAVVVMALDAEQAVALGDRRRHQRVVGAARGVLDERQDGTPLVGERTRRRRRRASFRNHGAAGLHGHPLGGVARAERPGVDHLRAVGVDDRMCWPARTRAALPRRAGIVLGLHRRPSVLSLRSRRCPLAAAARPVVPAIVGRRRRAPARRGAPEPAARSRRRAAGRCASGSPASSPTPARRDRRAGQTEIAQSTSISAKNSMKSPVCAGLGLTK